ncbi:MAG TPA: hypothetical protein DDW84_07615 [Phycisphaerales bacterium]|nr:MAG: hypothetical protein A2Y13_12515 [Planctomycetes bacterium GWC2_45_44]HBG78690.1 hypothetical protein [Phycisphaerales bacterium]HBR20040.1 hypothetical protein [Phycisphaerales bacterium]
MKKLILFSLCILFAGSTSAFGAYAVSGVVKDESGSVVSGAAVYINCYPAAGGSYSDTDTSSTVGGYSGGWLDKNCNNEKIVVKAVKGGKSGTVSWIAGGVVDVKNITISAPPAPTFELHCEATPIAMSEAHVATICPVNLYVQMAYIGPTIYVNGGSATLHYESDAMSCSSVAPRPPFIFTSPPVIDPIGGTITVHAETIGGTFVPVLNGEHVTSFFDVFFEAVDVNTPKLSSVRVTSEIYSNMGGIGTFPSRTENLIGTPHTSSGHLLIDSETEWLEALSSGHIRPLLADEWTGYMEQWTLYKDPDGDPYPTNTFMPAGLEVYGGGGGGGGGCEDAGLVMMWGEPTLPSGSYSSAWEYDYLLDPDLSNSTITVGVTPKQFGASGQINAVSFGIKDINGNVRSWWWSCPAPLPWNVLTTITIDTSKVGVAATNPVATGFTNNPAFNIKNSQFFIVDENFNWVFGQMPVPPPGVLQLGVMWNYWHNLIVTPNTSPYKGNYVKWSQPPVVDEATGMINGWDELSSYDNRPIVADDWECKDERPVTDIHWWGSFIGWTQPKLPPVLPKAFHIGIWTDVPAGADPVHPFSHPGTLVWENICDSWVWNFAGFDKDPQGRPELENEACFQFNQLLSQDEWFYQEPNGPEGKRVYWLSIAAIYNAGEQPSNPWGWKTRPHYFNDDAIRVGMVIDPTGLNIWPPIIGSQWMMGAPIEFPAGVSWDMAFELTTNEEGTPSADLNHDKIVNFKDFAIFASQWLTAGP